MNDLPNWRKVLYIDTALKVWGGQRSLYELVRNLDPGRYRAFAAVPEGSEVKDLLESVTEVRLLPVYSRAEGRRPGPYAALRAVRVLSRVIKDLKPDIVHANTFLGGLVLSVTPSRRVRRVLHQRDLGSHGLLSEWTAGKFDKIIAISGACASVHAGAERAGRVAIIPDGVDLSFAEKIPDVRRTAPIRRELGLGRSDLLVGAVGTISGQKSQHVLVEAAYALRDVPGLYFICVGGPYRAEDRRYLDDLLRRRSELRLDDRFFFVDYTPDLAAVYGSIDVLVHAAEREGLGRVILEAMGAGVPVVARGECGPSEIIDPGVDGYLYAPGDLEDLIGKLTVLINDPDLRRKVSERAVKKVRSEYAPAKTAELTQGVYDELLAG